MFIQKEKVKAFVFVCVGIFMLFCKFDCNAAQSVSAGDMIPISVTELDLGDCPKEIIKGTSQMLSVLPIPADATETDFVFESSNEEIATVNALGRLTAKEYGTATITVYCGDVKNSFEVSVVKDASKVAIEDIEIDEYEEELEVDKTLMISAKVLPINATDTFISYESSDEGIATVNSSGQVKGIAPGEVTIEVSAGYITKEIHIVVKMGTTAIRLNSEYVVLKPEETFQINAKVYPEEANKNLTYKSLDTEVATVSESGIITAKKCGDTAIIVSNEDIQVSVSVMVNESGTPNEIDVTDNRGGMDIERKFSEKVSADKYPYISSEMLKYFYEKEKTLTVKGNNYTIFVDGKNIVNFENKLSTKLTFNEEEAGFSFVVNNNNKLCGKLTLDISNQITDEKYLYLYNEAKEKYERLEAEDITLLTIDTSGKYLLTSEKLTKFEINYRLLFMGCVICMIGLGGFVVSKRRYWFW